MWWLSGHRAEVHPPHWRKQADTGVVPTEARRAQTDGTAPPNQNPHPPPNSKQGAVNTPAPVASVITGPLNRKGNPQILEAVRHFKNGSDYFSDYDIFSVSVPPDPQPENGQPLKFQYMNTTTNEFEFVWLSSRPRVALVPEFLTDEECDTLIQNAMTKLKRSLVVPHKGQPNQPISEVRTSEQTWFLLTETFTRDIVNRIERLIGFPPGMSEQLQLLRYEFGQKYIAHQDYFDPALHGPQKDNRAVTVFLYLSSTEEGGHTWFPSAMKSFVTTDYVSCTGGLGFKPHKRSAVVFYDMTPTGGYDPFSLHGGCPPKQGAKWAGTMWFHVRTP